MGNEVRKHFSVAEIRASDSGAEKTLSGYAATYNSLSPRGNIAGFRERISPGAFRKVLATEPDVRALINHNADAVIGRTKSGTLKLFEDNKGLRFVVTLPDTTQARDLWTLVKRGDMSGCSFAFACAPGDDSWSENEDGESIRSIGNFAALYDISVVTTPAYDNTSVDARGRKTSDDEWRTLAAMRLRLASVTL